MTREEVSVLTSLVLANWLAVLGQLTPAAPADASAPAPPAAPGAAFEVEGGKVVLVAGSTRTPLDIPGPALGVTLLGATLYVARGGSRRLIVESSSETPADSNGA